MPKSVNPRTVRTRGADSSEVTMGYVTWSSMMSGLRPIHSVETMTCTSEMSGTASSGVAVIAQMPHSVSTIVPVNTRKRLPAHQSMIRAITWLSCPGLLRGHRRLLRRKLLPAPHRHHRHVPFARHHHLPFSPVD